MRTAAISALHHLGRISPRGGQCGRVSLKVLLLEGLLALLLALVAAVSLLVWSLKTESGAAWVLRQWPGVQAEALKGSLLGDFSAGRLVLPISADGATLVLSGVEWRGMALSLTLNRAVGQGAWARLALERLSIRHLDHVPGKSPGAPLSAPEHLRLPVELRVGSLTLGEAHSPALGKHPLRDLSAALALGADGGQAHRIERLQFAWHQLTASGSASLGANAPLTLNATMEARHADWAAQATLDGPLAAPELVARLRAAGASPDAGTATDSARKSTRAAARDAAKGRADDASAGSAQGAALDARATIRPFAPWPLSDLQASLRALDLSALHSDAPRTALSGSALLKTSGLDQPAELTVSLTNADAGRWNDSRVPVRRLDVVARGRLDDPHRLDLRRLDAELGTRSEAAGAVKATAQLSPREWSLDASLTAVQPAMLDTRAAPMRLSGLVSLKGMFDAAARDTRAARAGWGDALDVRAALEGRLSAGAKKVLNTGAEGSPVSLVLDASARAGRIELRQAEARIDRASARLKGTATQAANQGPWQVLAHGDLNEFDPLPWWPGREGSAWRRGTHRWNASADVDLQLPANALVTGSATAAADPALPDRLATLRGQATLTIEDSVLAGVPVRGDASWRSPAAQQTEITLDLDAGGNRVGLRAQLASLALVAGTGSAGAADARTGAAANLWDMTLAAPALERLGPLLALSDGLSAQLGTRLGGSMNGSTRFSGQWPQLKSQGQLDAGKLRAGPYSLQRGQIRWQLGTAPDAPTELRATLTQPTVDGRSLEQVEVDLKGTARAHELTLRAESKALPPAWTDALVAGGGVPADRSIARLQASGGLLLAGPGAAPRDALSGWRGKLHNLELRGNAPPDPAWLLAQDIDLEAAWSHAAERAIRLTVQPGRAQVAGAVLRWDALQWQSGAQGQPARVQAQARLEPLSVAPLLARLQPDFGWGGDLRVGGNLALDSGAGVKAELVLERIDGDLSVTDDISTQALGLSDMRLALTADGGVWTFTQALAGKTLGVAAGAIVARAAPEAPWPPPDTPLQGVVEVQVANLGAWGTWVPAGWRLAGQLRTSASIGGTLAGPEFTGEVLGSGIGVRNLLQGVSVTDGRVDINLQGATARIREFSARAGAGTVRLDGEARLGSEPQVQVTLLAEKFQLIGRVDRRIVTSGRAQMRLDRDAVALQGRFGVDEGLIDFSRGDAPSLSGDVVVVRATPAAQTKAAASSPPPKTDSRRVDLDLQVDLGEQLQLRGRGLDTGLRGALRLSAPGGKLAVNGTVSTYGGTYEAYSQKLSIDRGQISFSGPVDNPRLDVEATRPNLDVRVGVLISGGAQNPRIRLFSEPDLADSDKLSWLVLGRASEGLDRADTALLQRAALALLSGGGDGITDRLIRTIGLDELSVRQTEGDVRETVVSLGKQLSRRWYVGYERGLNAATGSWQLIYRIAQRFTLRAQSGEVNSMDVIWTWRWQ